MGILDSIIRIDNEVDTQTDLIAQIAESLEGKAAGSGGTGKLEQDKIIVEDITTNGSHTFYPDDGYTMAKVTVNINVPTGTTETWTFTMEDGSEVTKDVVVA